MADERELGARAGVGMLGYARAGVMDGGVLPRWGRVLVVGVALPAAVSGWLPFAWGYSPSGASEAWAPWEILWAWARGTPRSMYVDWTLLVLMAPPFFTGVLLAAWSARLALWTRGSFWERAVLWVAAWGALVMTGVVMSRFLWQGGDRPDAWRAMLGGVAAGFGLLVMGLLWWRFHHRDVATSVLLGTAYAANACVSLVMFHDRVSIGWWVTAAAVGGILAEMGIHMMWAVLAVAGQQGR